MKLILRAMTTTLPFFANLSYSSQINKRPMGFFLLKFNWLHGPFFISKLYMVHGTPIELVNTIGS